MKRYIKSAISPITDEAICDVLEIARTCQDRTYLEQIATTGSDVLKCEVAKNPNLPEEFIRKLYNEHGFRIDESLVENPATPSDILDEIAKSEPSERLLRRIAEHPNSLPETLEYLAGLTEYWLVRQKVAKNPNTPRSVLQSLSKDPEIPVRTIALRTLKSLNS